MAHKIHNQQMYDSILSYIIEYYDRHGYNPSVRDIMNGVGVLSSSTIHGYLKRMMKNGDVTFDHYKNRSIIVTDQGVERVLDMCWRV